MNLNARQQGVLVTNVDAGSIADQVGMLVGNQTLTVDGQDIAIGGDVITEINGQPVVEYNALQAYLVMHTTPGDKVSLTVLRQGQTMTIPMTVGTFPSQ
jgi:S1-C subfamily serine protease